MQDAKQAEEVPKERLPLIVKELNALVMSLELEDEEGCVFHHTHDYQEGNDFDTLAQEGIRFWSMTISFNLDGLAYLTIYRTGKINLRIRHSDIDSSEKIHQQILQKLNKALYSRLY